MNQILYQLLIQTAQSRTTVTYTQAGNAIGLNMNNPNHVNQISQLLDEISINEHNQNRPLLSAVVVHQENQQHDTNRIPGTGFFTMAKNIRRFNGNNNAANRDEFWILEWQAVINRWR